ncbi:MAG TPA: DEAD/DEAH box helicase [Pirellulales bacterium]|jgi:SNF2 family DNA or RNA helicase
MTAPVAWSWQKQAEQPPETWSLVLSALTTIGGPPGDKASEPEAQKPATAADLLKHFDTASTPGSRPIPRSLASGVNAVPPKVVSIQLRAPRFAVRSYQFTPRGDDHARALPKSADEAPAPSAPLSIGTSPACRSYTRVKPPEDVIGLVDRLSVLLEPPLESLLAGECLEFPAQPFPFQMEGVAFLYPRHAALLADEMGLGKTMQSITAMRLLIHTREVRRVLLVCPKPLVSNWCREFHRWAPELPLLVIEGDRAKRRWQWQQAEAPIMIANYELLRRDTDIVTAPDLHFDLVVLDESQRIKNRSGSTSQVVRAISRTRSWALTGTPVENSPDDLIGIFDFLRPGHLSSSMKPRRLGRVAGDYVLRRTKSQVLADLPPKLFRDADLDLLPEQRESYRLAEEEGVLRLTEMGDAATIQHVFELILRLKQICNFDPATGASAKLERLTADMEEVAASGQKVLVFSQWVETLTTLRKRLARFKPLEYHGSVPAANRDGVLREFHDDPRRHILLLSYGAGGVGLNLQFASYVFLFDRWWNPAVEDQAINRAHRIGAAGPVTVTRFLSPGTIEERIEQILRDKRELFDAIFSGAATPRLGLSQEQIFGLFRLKCPAGPVHAAG